MNNLNLLSDQPITGNQEERQDGLNFHVYAKTLASAAAHTTGPFTIGIFGEWGTGKTSLMQMIEHELSSTYPETVTVWFNAWRFEQESHPIVPLVATIVRELERKRTVLEKFTDGGRALLRGLRAVAYGFSAKSKVQIPGFAEIEAGFVAKDMIERDERLSPDPLLDRSLYYEAFDTLSNIKYGSELKIVVIVDDLDRCFPDSAIKLLESIKLVLTQPGFIFVLGVARNIIEGYLQHRYEKEYGLIDFEGRAYLDKIIQLPFYIPPHRGRIKQFSGSLLKTIPKADQEVFQGILPIIGSASGSNPRTIIRFVNNLLIDREIHKSIASRELKEVPISYFAISRSLQQRWPSVFRLLSTSDELCQKLIEWDGDKLEELMNSSDPTESELARKLLIDADLHELLFEHGIDWLTNAPLRGETIQFLRVERVEPNAKIAETVSFVSPPVDRVYIAHPYLSLPKDKSFVGRETEFELLNNWITPEENEEVKEKYQLLKDKRVLAIISLGGTGKSALLWTWFNFFIKLNRRTFRGHIWWSFHEDDSFENFITHVLSYVVGTRRVATSDSDSRNMLIQLRENLESYFDRSELREVCFRLGINHENFRQQTTREFIFELLEYLQRRNQIQELILTVKKLRPNANWDVLTPSSREETEEEKFESIQKMTLPQREQMLLRILDEVPYLIMLDGLEQLLIAYQEHPTASVESEKDNSELPLDENSQEPYSQQLRNAKNPRVDTFIKRLADTKTSRILISSRLAPKALETISGELIPNAFIYPLE